MPYKEKIIKKKYYSISEVAKKFDVTTSLIRFWEKEFTSLHPKKNQKGKRQFTENDIQLFGEIYYLVKEKGYTLNGAKEELKKEKNSTDSSEIINQLKDVRSFLVSLKSNL